jgi:GH15 family glucan-1,4-alpha-glucosidase
VRLEDYALIGDTHTAALVGRNGSLDWLCVPRFDSPACFAALLGTPAHGRRLLAPSDEIRQVSRRYRGDSLVLETEFTTNSGTVRVIECMPPRTREPIVARLVEGVSGSVQMDMDLIIRFDYGSIVPWVRTVDGHLLAIGGPDAVVAVGASGNEGRRSDDTFVIRGTAGRIVWFRPDVAPITREA